MSRLLVVDASVVRAAGESAHPVSKACRECLEAILTICHRVAVTNGIQAEWRGHASRFSRKWLRAMFGRRKLPALSRVSALSLNLDAYGERDRNAIEKDRHLLEAALACEKLIVTLDDALKASMEERKHGSNIAAGIRWVHPVRDGVDALRSL